MQAARGRSIIVSICIIKYRPNRTFDSTSCTAGWLYCASAACAAALYTCHANAALSAGQSPLPLSARAYAAPSGYGRLCGSSGLAPGGRSTAPCSSSIHGHPLAALILGSSEERTLHRHDPADCSHPCIMWEQRKLTIIMPSN